MFDLKNVDNYEKLGEITEIIEIWVCLFEVTLSKPNERIRKTEWC
jgi:hypothetical protein